MILCLPLIVADLKAVIAMAAVKEKQFLILSPKSCLQGCDLGIGCRIFQEHFIIRSFRFDRDDLRLRITVGKVDAGQTNIGTCIDNEAGSLRSIKFVVTLDKHLFKSCKVRGADSDQYRVFDSRKIDFNGRCDASAFRKQKKRHAFHPEFGIIKRYNVANPMDDVHVEEILKRRRIRVT